MMELGGLIKSKIREDPPDDHSGEGLFISEQSKRVTAAAPDRRNLLLLR